jgi:two-component sensor histidine kinase
MDDDAAKIRKLLRQQGAIARFGSYALRQTDLMKVLTEAARACAEGLDVRFAKVCEYRQADNDLLVVAGYGWQPGVVGHVVSRADISTPQGRAFITGEPSISNDLQQECDFELPPFYADHRIVSTVDVIIKGSDRPYGVLEIDNDEQHDYDEYDINYLTGFANVLAEAVATAARVAILQTNVEQMKMLVEDKDRLLEQKRVLSQELQHRVRNNLQLVYGMLSRQLEHTDDRSAHQGIKAIARRVSTLARVYDHLLGSEMTRTTDFGSYLKSLCLDLAELHAAQHGRVTLSCESDVLTLDLDVVTALGIVVTELVTNGFDHAFPSGNGAIMVSLRGAAAETGLATMTISDNGTGFTPNIQSKRHGLGLVRRLIEQVSGTVTVESDHGMTWTLKIPTVHSTGPVAIAA